MAQGTDGETPSLPGQRAFRPEYSRAAPRPLSPGRARVSRAIPAWSGRPGNGWLRGRTVRHRPYQASGPSGPNIHERPPRPLSPGRARVPRALPAWSGRPGNGWLRGRTVRHRPYQTGGPENGRLGGRTVRHRPYRVFLFFTPPAAFFRNLWECNSCCKEGAVPPNPRWGCLLRYHLVNSSQPKRSGVWKLPLNSGFEARKARWARSMR